MSNEDDLPEVLYHYTSAQGLLGILQSRVLWATDTRYLNDDQELRYGSAILLDALNTAADVLDPDNSYDPQDRAKAKATELRMAAEIIEHGAIFDSNELGDAYVACFCDDWDQLGQWRGYGANGGGFAVGFKASALVKLGHKLQIPDDKPNVLAVPGPHEVSYGPEATTARCKELVRVLTKLSPNANPVAAGHFDAYRLCLPQLAFMKDSAFSGEREWRVLVINIADRTLKFRPHPSLGIAPYIDIAFPADAISEVIVGPGAHTALRKQAVEQLLTENKYTDTNVRTSEASYRP